MSLRVISCRPLSYLSLSTSGVLSFSLIPQSISVSNLLLLQPQECLFLFSCWFSWRIMFNKFNNRDMDGTYASFPSDHYVQVPSTVRPRNYVCMHMNIFQHFVLIPLFSLQKELYIVQPHIFQCNLSFPHWKESQYTLAVDFILVHREKKKQNGYSIVFEN